MAYMTIVLLVAFAIVSIVVFGSLYFWIRFMERKTQEVEREKIRADYQSDMSYIKGYKQGYLDAMNGKKMNLRK